MQVMASHGATFFFDRDTDFVTGYTSTLRTEFVFGGVADGTAGNKAASDKLYKQFVQGSQARIIASVYDSDIGSSQTSLKQFDRIACSDTAHAAAASPLGAES
jgi:hypothetical protein